MILVVCLGVYVGGNVGNKLAMSKVGVAAVENGATVEEVATAAQQPAPPSAPASAVPAAEDRITQLEAVIGDLSQSVQGIVGHLQMQAQQAQAAQAAKAAAPQPASPGSQFPRPF